MVSMYACQLTVSTVCVTGLIAACSAAAELLRFEGVTNIIVGVCECALRVGFASLFIVTCTPAAAMPLQLQLAVQL